MRLAIIDMGTNSIRYSIYEVLSEENATLVYKQKDMIRPGKGVFTLGVIDESGIERITESFLNWKKISQKYEVTKTITIATSALRTARNAEAVVQAILAETGDRIRIISGTEEARLIAKGVLSAGFSLPKRVALIDIGGGSTELSLVENQEVLWSHSFPLGSQRLKQMFPQINPPADSQTRVEQIKLMREKVAVKLIGLSKHLKGQSFEHVVGTAGTIKAIARVLTLRKSRMNGEKKYIQELVLSPDTMSFEFTDLKQLNGELEVSTRANLSFLEGLEPKRRDLIIPGSILLEELCSILRAKRIQTSSSSLRDGVLRTQMETEFTQIRR